MVINFSFHNNINNDTNERENENVNLPNKIPMEMNPGTKSEEGKKKIKKKR